MSKNKKIFFFVSSFMAGGKERRSLELLKSLQEDTEYQIIIILLRDMISYPQYDIKHYPKYVIGHDDTINLITFIRLIKLYIKEKPAVIHCWSVATATYSSLLKILFRFKIVNSQIADASFNNKITKVNIQNNFSFQFSDIIISNSQAGLKKYKVPKSKCKVIGNGIDFKRFENLMLIDEVKLKYNICTPYSVCMVAGFNKRKDYHTFLECAKEITETRKDISFICIGDGETYDYYSMKYKNIAQIIFTGQISEVENLINICTLGVLMTNTKIHEEGISNSILEYMALSKPVIANNSGGTQEIVINQKTGFITDSFSVKQLQEKIEYIINHPKEAQIMGNLGRSFVIDNYSIDKMKQNFYNIYKEMLGIK